MAKNDQPPIERVKKDIIEAIGRVDKTKVHQVIFRASDEFGPYTICLTVPKTLWLSLMNDPDANHRVHRDQTRKC